MSVTTVAGADGVPGRARGVGQHHHRGHNRLGGRGGGSPMTVQAGVGRMSVTTMTRADGATAQPTALAGATIAATTGTTMAAMAGSGVAAGAAR